MSQVKKLQSGGSITIGGTKYEATPELVQQLTDHLSKYGDAATPLAGLTNALLNGENVVYDPVGNTITGMQGKWVGVDDRTEARRASSRRTSQWARDWDATLNTDKHKFNKALTLLAGFRPKSTSDNAAATSNLKDIFGDKVWFAYDPDNKYLEDDNTNLGIATRLDRATDYLYLPEEEGNKTYKLGSYYTPEVVTGLRELAKKYDRPDWDRRLAGIKERAKNNNLTPEDEAFLKNFNIVRDPDGTQSNNPRDNAEKAKWNQHGVGDLFDTLGGRAHINPDGSISLNDGESWGWDLGDLEGRNIWFNDDFYRSKYGATGVFDPYKNYTLYNGRLYGINNPRLAAILNAPGGYNELLQSGNWSGADQEILTRFTPAAKENPESLNPERYSEFLSSHPTYLFSDLTGLYNGVNIHGMGDDGNIEYDPQKHQIIQYIDLNDDTKSGPYKRYNYHYAVLDEFGKHLMDINEDNLKWNPVGQTREGGLQTHYRIADTSNKAYYNRYYDDILDANGKATGFRMYYNINNPNADVILHIPEIKASGIGQQDLHLPKEMAKILSEKIKNNPNWLGNIIGNAQNKQNFINMMSELVRSRGISFNRNWSTLFNNYTRQLKNMGFSDDEITRFLASWDQARRGSRSDRRSTLLVDSPYVVSEKNGGVLKNQDGGKAGGSKESTGVTEVRVNSKDVNPKNAAGITEIGGKNWTRADSADIGALVADLGSLGLAFVPGGNVASAITGATGSTARLLADKERGTKGAGWNYLLSLGMDAATLVPVLGGAAKAGKIARGIKAALPTIIKGASVFGLSTTFVNTAKKIANGEKFTVRDVDMVINGLTAMAGLKQQGGLGKQSKTASTRGFKDQTLKVGESEITISGNKLQEIAKASDQPKALREAIRAEAPNADNKAVAEAAEKLLAPSKRTLKQRILKQDSDIKLNLKQEKLPQTTTEEANGNWLHDWWYRLNGESEAVKNTIRGEQPAVTKVVSGVTRVYQPKTVKFGDKDIKFTADEVAQIAGRHGDIKGLLMSKLPKEQKEQWAQLYSAFNKIKNPTALKGVVGKAPRWYRSRLSSQSWKQPGLGISVGPVRGRVRWYDTRAAVALPQIITPLKLAGYEDVQPEGVVMKPVFKKGGKIIKAQYGIKTPNFNFQKSTLNPITGNNVPSTLNVDLSKAYALPGTTYDPITATKTTNYADINGNVTSETTPFTGGVIASSASSKSVNPGNNSQGLKPGTPRFYDPTVPLNWGRALYSMSRSNKQLKNWLQLPTLQMQAPLTNAPRFINSGTGDAYRTSGKKLKLHKASTSDATMDWLTRQQELQKALGLELQGSLADSQEYGQYKAFLDDYNNKVALRNTDISNKNRELRWNKQVQDVQMKNANIAEKSKFFDQAAYTTQDWITKNLYLRNQLRANQDTNIEYSNIMDTYKNEVAAANLIADETTRNNALWTAKFKAENALKQIGMEQQAYQLPWMFAKTLKNGGTITKSSGNKDSKVTYSRDPYPDLLLQNSKGVDKFVEKLSDHTIKLILQAKPLYVSK